MDCTIDENISHSYITGFDNSITTKVTFFFGVSLLSLDHIFADFQKAAAFIHEFLLKMNEDMECAELRDTLNLALLHMQKYYRALQVEISVSGPTQIHQL